MTRSALLMEDDIQRRQQLLSLAEKIFLQVARLFLRHNVQVKELERSLRWACIRVAARDPEFAIDNREEGFKQSFSHVAVTTGITRQEVSARIDDEHANVDVSGNGLNRLIRILTGWRTDEGYQDEHGRPLDLPLRGGPPSFHQLCRKYGRDTPTRPIADVLVKNGNAEWIGEQGNYVREKALRYLQPVVTADFNSTTDLAILAQIGSDFLHSFQRTFNSDVKPRPRFREGYFNDIDVSKKDEVLSKLHEKLQQFNVECTGLLKEYRVKDGQRGIRVGVGSYSFWDAPLFLNLDSEESE